MTKWDAPKIGGLIVGLIAFLFLLVIGLKGVLKWDWSLYFVAVVYLAVGLWFFGEGSWKSVTSTASKKFKWQNLLHSFAFAFGILFVYIGLITLPKIGAIFTMPAVSSLTGWITFVGALVGLAEIWVD